MTVRMVAVEFKRQKNPDGTWDSICLRCFATIASAEQEEELAQSEITHNCWFPLAGDKVN
jgi:hypothetical protein